MDFTMTDGTTLGDLLALQLHLFEEEVRNIVDKAVKEMAIEKVPMQWTLLIKHASLLYDIIQSYLPIPQYNTHQSAFVSPK